MLYSNPNWIHEGLNWEGWLLCNLINQPATSTLISVKSDFDVKIYFAKVFTPVIKCNLQYFMKRDNGECVFRCSTGNQVYLS